MTDSEFSSAVQSLIHAIQADPVDLESYGRLAGLYATARSFRKAELVLLQAVDVAPLHAETWNRLGALYSNLGKWTCAVDAFARACPLNPRNSDYWVGYGLALLATQDLENATRARDALLKQFPDRSETHLIAGHISKVQGHFDAAIASYRVALQLEPHQADAAYNLVDLAPPGMSDPLTRTLELRRQESSLSDREMANICFTLARVYEHADQIDSAYRALQDANRAASATMARFGQLYDPQAMAAAADELIDVFTADVFPTSLEPLDVGVKMIFVVGLPRSGTTLVDRILSSHSQVMSGGELPFMQECLEEYRVERRTSGRRGRIDVANEQERKVLARLREGYLDRIFERELDGAYVVDKLPANVAALGLIRVLFPDAIVVHCRRDPVATCWSLYRAHFGNHCPYYTSFDHLTHYYKVYSKLMTHWGAALIPPVVEVQYEDLVAHPECKVRALLDACGLHWEDDCLRFERSRKPVYTASMQQVRQPLYATSVSRWRRFAKHLTLLSDSLAERLEAHNES
jgi:tetratricopeptide (TPR) repeat protein